MTSEETDVIAWLGTMTLGKRKSAATDATQALEAANLIRRMAAARGELQDRNMKLAHELEAAHAARTEATNNLVNLIHSEKRLLDAVERKRRRLPDTRSSITRKFSVHRADEEALRVYVTVGLYEDGSPGELFIKCDRQGSLTSGAFDAVALVVSMALQHGVALSTLTGKLRGMRFEPAGMTGDKTYPICNSVLDLVARWLDDHFNPKAVEPAPPLVETRVGLNGESGFVDPGTVKKP